MRTDACLTAVVLGLALLLGGCSSPPTQVLTVPGGQYEEAFGSVLAVLRAEGYPAELRDPRAGVIESAPRPAPTLLEPWHQDGASFDDRVRDTLSAHRRRVRVEFRPAGAIADMPLEQPLVGADLLAIGDPEPPLTTVDGPVEIRVWVWLEQAHASGVRRDPWSRRLTTRTDDPLRPSDPTPRVATRRGRDDLRSSGRVSWHTVARDPDVEAVLLARIAAGLADGNRPTDG